MTIFDRLKEEALLSAIVKTLTINSPSSAEELLNMCGLPLQFIGWGQFRNVYTIVGTPYVLKVPNSSDGEEHAVDEVRAITRISTQKKYVHIRPYMPVVHYRSTLSGLLLMDYYSPIAADDKRFDSQINHLAEWLSNRGYKDADVALDKKDNYGISREGKLTLLDLGCFVK